MILVVSATGMVDGMIPLSLLDQERQARALVWSPDSVDRLGAWGAETLVGGRSHISVWEITTSGATFMRG
jgi:hypothetical protein